VASQSQHRQWNLRMADKHLIEAFISEIRLLRQFQNIPNPHPNKGKKYRGVSWKYIELLDLKKNRLGRFDDGERHTLSEGRRLAKRYFVQYEQALAEWNKNIPSPDSGNEDEDPDDSYGTTQDGLSF
jgi:hypothetical protein